MRPLALAVLAVLPSLALGYDIRPFPQPGNTVTYHIDVNSLTATQRATIIAAAAAWDAGNGQILRGANWTFNVETMAASQMVCTVGVENSRNEVYMRDGDWLDDHGVDNAAVLAVHLNRVLDDDLVFNSDFPWCSSALPSHTSCRGNPQVSIGAVAVHEWGHVIGFDHEDDFIATMNSYYPNGGDLGQTAWRIHEDDAAGLMDLKGDSSTGFNLLLGRWLHNIEPDDPTTPDVDEEGALALINWERPVGFPYQVRRSDSVWTTPVPQAVALVHTGTGSRSVRVEWRVSTKQACRWTTSHVVGSRTPSVSTNLPYVVEPNAWDFSAVPAGTYWLCAEVAPADTHAETSEVDNLIVSTTAIVQVI